MPKKASTPFTYYTFRYDYTDDNQVEKIKNYIEKEIPKYAIFNEISDVVGKKHLQGKIGKEISEIQLRKHFKAEFPDWFIKSNYSIVRINDEEKYDSYICKGGKVVINNIFTDDYIKEQVEKHKEIVTKGDNKKEKLKTLNFYQQVAVDFVKQYPKECEYIQWIPYKPDDNNKKLQQDALVTLLDYLLKRLGSLAKEFDDNMLQRKYNGIKNYIIQLDVEASRAQTNKYKNRIEL